MFVSLFCLTFLKYGVYEVLVVSVLHDKYLLNMSIWLVAGKVKTNLVVFVVADNKSNALEKACSCEPFSSLGYSKNNLKALNLSSHLYDHGYDVLLSCRSNYH